MHVTVGLYCTQSSPLSSDSFVILFFPYRMRTPQHGLGLGNGVDRRLQRRNLANSLCDIACIMIFVLYHVDGSLSRMQACWTDAVRDHVKGISARFSTSMERLGYRGEVSRRSAACPCVMGVICVYRLSASTCIRSCLRLRVFVLVCACLYSFLSAPACIRTLKNEVDRKTRCVSMREMRGTRTSTRTQVC